MSVGGAVFPTCTHIILYGVSGICGLLSVSLDDIVLHEC